MTCVIGLVEAGKVYIGADSAGSNAYMTRLNAYPKVFRLGEMLIGYTDSFRMAQILQYQVSINPQQEKEDEWAYMVTSFVEGVRGAFKEFGYAKVENNQEEGGAFLIGYRGQLYAMYDDFQIAQFTDSYNAVGSGTQYALGAMAALEGVSPKKRIKKALKIASYFQGYVQPPFKIMSLGG